MTELFDFFELVCIETSIPLDNEIKTVTDLKLLIVNHENYEPQSNSCRNYVHVLDSLMQKAGENTSQEVVKELSDLLCTKLMTCPINQIKYGIANLGDLNPDTDFGDTDFGDIDEPIEAITLIRWLFNLQYLSNFRFYLESMIPTETMKELKKCLNIFYNNNDYPYGY